MTNTLSNPVANTAASLFTASQKKTTRGEVKFHPDVINSISILVMELLFDFQHRNHDELRESVTSVPPSPNFPPHPVGNSARFPLFFFTLQTYSY